MRCTSAKITTEDELLGLTEYAPQFTAEVLLALNDGLSPDEVLDAGNYADPAGRASRRD